MKPLDWMDAQRAVAEDGGAGAQDPAAEQLLDGLNEPQRHAVTHGEGPLLILAGAGSGKTRAITRRIAWLVATGRANPQEILAITFTNKAAREMRARVEALLPSSGAWIGTFHATCARILRREIEVLGGWTRDFSIYDTTDRNDLIKRTVKDLGYDTQRFRPALVAAWISDWKTARAVGEGTEGLGGLGGIEGEVLNAVWTRYEESMRASNALDFDDLLVRTLELFDRHPGVRDAYASRFRYVLVDEYQDTNRVQYLLVRHLAGWHGNLNVCGDPDQSIYAWRGADIRNILDFEEDFGAQRDGVARRVEVVKLEQNYRSTPSILKAAQALIQNNAGRKEKDLWTEKVDVDKVQVLQCGDEEDEAGTIAARIHSLHAQGVRPDQVAIFYRANFMQRALERGLRLSGVPYQIVGGVEFYQRKEIRDLVSYLQLIVNPVDDVCCRRVLNVPQRGIGDKSLERLAEWSADRRVSLLDAARSTEARAGIRGRAKAGLAAFAELYARLEDLRDKPAALALEFVIDEIGFEEWIAQSEENAESRIENVDELVAHAHRYDEEEPEGFLRGFLQEIALVSDVDGYDEEGPKVTLMTLHASKGLEFPVVFVSGCEEELLPHGLAISENGEAGVEEERRLFYVGMTRAEERLFLTHATTRMHYGESSWRRPSRFLDELPKDCVVGVEGAEDDEDEVLGVFEPDDADTGLREGAAVEHDHFGRGRVLKLQGAGANARVTVEFAGVGSKVLLMQYAKLRVLGG